MKITPIVRQLNSYLPFYTDKFTDTVNIVSATQLGGIATITTSIPHNLSLNQQILITEIRPLIEISNVSIINTNQLLIQTNIDNGLVDSFDFLTLKDKLSQIPNLYTTLFPDIEFNGSFPILNVSNRFNVICQLPFTPSSTPSFYGYLIKYAFNTYVGVKKITNVVSSTQFQYVVNPSESAITTNSGLIHYNSRISGVIDIDSADASYTKQSSSNYWLFVTQNSSYSSKNRQILNDGLDNVTTGVEYRQRMIESINVFIFVPISDQLSSRSAVDSLEDVKVALFKTLLRFKLPNQYDTTSSFQLYFDSTNLVANRKSYMIQQFIFESEYDLTYYDGFDPNLYTPFRNINGTSSIKGNELTWGVDLDDDLSYN